MFLQELIRKQFDDNTLRISEDQFHGILHKVDFDGDHAIDKEELDALLQKIRENKEFLIES